VAKRVPFGLPYNLYYSIYFFFSRNNVFLSQQFNQNSIFQPIQPSFNERNGPWLCSACRRSCVSYIYNINFYKIRKRVVLLGVTSARGHHDSRVSAIASYLIHGCPPPPGRRRRTSLPVQIWRRDERPSWLATGDSQIDSRVLFRSSPNSKFFHFFYHINFWTYAWSIKCR